MRRLFSYLTLVLCGLSLAGVATPAPQHSAFPGSNQMADAHFAIADFDGDQQADLATVQGSAVTSSQSRYWIRFQLTTGERQSFGITAPVGGLELSTRDVNGDNVPDVIVSTSWLNRPVAILLNNGYGKFSLVDPAQFPGVVWDTRNSQTLNAPLLNETAALSLIRSSDDVCEAGYGPASLLLFPQRIDHAFSSSPALPDVLIGHGRAPPALIHHV